jgi:hypothetical protein
MVDARSDSEFRAYAAADFGPSFDQSAYAVANGRADR